MIHWENSQKTESILVVSSYSRDHSDLELETFDWSAYWTGRLSVAGLIGLGSGAAGGGPLGEVATALVVDATGITNRAGNFYANVAIPPGNVSVTMVGLHLIVEQFRSISQ